MDVPEKTGRSKRANGEGSGARIRHPEFRGQRLSGTVPKLRIADRGDDDPPGAHRAPVDFATGAGETIAADLFQIFEGVPAGTFLTGDGDHLGSDQKKKLEPPAAQVIMDHA
ncbi:MAG: hypothetical protein R6W66_07435 [Pelovirga sp.]